MLPSIRSGSIVTPPAPDDLRGCCLGSTSKNNNISNLSTTVTIILFEVRNDPPSRQVYNQMNMKSQSQP